MPGEPGLWLLLMGDLTFFAILFAIYLKRFGQHREEFTTSQEHLSLGLGTANTLVLLTSSFLVVCAAQAIRLQRHRLASRFTLAGLLVGACFTVIKAVEYYSLFSAGINPTTNDFFMFYFVLTGLHLVHVEIGLIVLAWMSRLASKPAPSENQLKLFEGGACFWHMVDLLWLVIFPLLFVLH